ncbi:MAG TPA: EAL domain-containing protein, partial [Burkholderiales bacterium]
MIWTPIRRLRIQLVAAAAVVIALLWSAIAYHLRSEREAALRVATQQGQNLSNIVAEHFSSYAAAIDLLLRNLRNRWAQDPGHFADAVALEKGLREDKFTFQVSVVDGRGWLAYSDTESPGARVFLGDSEYFKFHGNAGDDRLYLSTPARGGASARPSIQFTRAIPGKKGVFSGVLVLSVSPDALIRVYEGLDLGSNGLVGIRGPDNTLLLRWPDIGATGTRRLPEIPSTASGAAKGATDIRRGGLDGVERIFSFRRIPDFPMYAVVGQSLVAVLAESSKDRWLYLAAGGLGSLVVLFFGFVMLSNLKREEQSEDDLRRFRAAMDVSADLIMLVDPKKLRYVDVNDAACRALGYSREELLEKGPHDVFSITREELSELYRRLLEGNESDRSIEGWYRRKDGTRLPVETFRRAVPSAGGTVVVAVARDLTERLSREEDLRRFRLAMDHSADMIVLIDRATMRFVDVNRTACRLLGYSREELLRMGPQDVLPVGREELERNYDSLIAKPTGDTVEISRGMKSHYICKDGSLLPFESTRHVLRSGDSTIIAAISRDIRERLAAEEKVAYLAQFDALTGLPNRNLFQDRLTQAMALAKRNDWPMAVLFIDLDRFKLVNDTLGHGAGDKLLREAARRLRSCIRSSDTVGRLGGDEFAAILSELGRPADAGQVARKIIDVFKRPFDLDGKETYVTASVGITLYPADSDSAEALVVNADAAMYRAKEQGRNNYQYFTKDMNERAIRRVQMEAELRRALERDEFLLFYQPKADLATGKICGFEALLRWQQPEKGIVLPGTFIPVLEETGLIVQTGEWVLRTTCAQIKAWQKSGLKVPPISVNLSARQFEQKNLIDLVRQILRDTEVDPSLIEFEITESLLMKDPEGAARTLHDLKESGVRLSVDDFGTGYSSLAYLKRFPIDTLKIDRTFIHDLTTDADDATLTRAIINLAQNLRLKVVAEGVETEAQLAFLCSNGCDEMQG